MVGRSSPKLPGPGDCAAAAVGKAIASASAISSRILLRLNKPPVISYLLGSLPAKASAAGVWRPPDGGYGHDHGTGLSSSLETPIIER
jgi:hypothetical protein